MTYHNAVRQSDLLTVISFAYRHERVWETLNKWDDFIGALGVNYGLVQIANKSALSLSQVMACYNRTDHARDFLRISSLDRKSRMNIE